MKLNYIIYKESMYWDFLCCCVLIYDWSEFTMTAALILGQFVDYFPVTATLVVFKSLTNTFFLAISEFLI